MCRPLGNPFKEQNGVRNMKFPQLVAALNLSPESFYVGSRVTAMVAAERLRRSVHAKVIDIGAKSTRPPNLYEGEEHISEEEIRRLAAAVDLIVPVAEELGKELSIDTQSARVAEFALERGFTIVNDISGLKGDPSMAEVVARYDAQLVVMATKRLPGDCQNMDEVMEALRSSVEIALDHGVKRQRMMIDPGFGGWQGKGPDCDFDIIRNFGRLRELELPVYAGISRKSTVAALGGANDPVDRLPGSLALSIWLARQGVDYLRTHDVEETYRAIKVWGRIASLDGSEKI